MGHICATQQVSQIWAIFETYSWYHRHGQYLLNPTGVTDTGHIWATQLVSQTQVTFAPHIWCHRHGPYLRRLIKSTDSVEFNGMLFIEYWISQDVELWWDSECYTWSWVCNVSFFTVPSARDGWSQAKRNSLCLHPPDTVYRLNADFSDWLQYQLENVSGSGSWHCIDRPSGL